MIPKAAFLGSRPARNTGENPFGQRADGDFGEVEDKYGDVIDVKFDKSMCRACGKTGTVYNSDNGLKVCRACSVVQNDGNPEGEKMSPKTKDREMGNFRRALTSKKL
jgi:hypothetical protein